MSNYQKTKITYRASFWVAIALAATVAFFGGPPAWISLPAAAVFLVFIAGFVWYALEEAFSGCRDCAAFAGGIAATVACLASPWILCLFSRLAGWTLPVPWWLSFLQIAASALVLALLRGNGDDPVTPLSGCSSTKVPPSGRWFDAGILSIVLGAAFVSGLAAGSALADFGLTADRLKALF